MNSFKNLIVYQKSIDFVIDIYQLTKGVPSVEKFGLISQLRRASVSIPSNISEGSQRQSRSEYVRFVYMSYGSCAELETQLTICKKLEYVSEGKYDELLEN